MNAKGVKQTQIAASLGISTSTIKRAKAKLAKHGDIEAGRQKPGPKLLMPPGIQDVLFRNFICIS
jgi:transposase